MKLVRYLKGTNSLGIFYPRRQHNAPLKVEIISYVDSAFADCLETRKSTGGYLVLLNGSPLTWRSGKQSIVTHSTTEAEYVQASDGTKEIVWVRNLLTDMGVKIEGPTVLYEDNNGCIAMTENPLHHKRTKHIDISYHYTRDMVENEIVVLKKVSSEEQLADILTKPLGKVAFQRLVKGLNMRETHVHVPK